MAKRGSKKQKWTLKEWKMKIQKLGNPKNMDTWNYKEQVCIIASAFRQERSHRPPI